MSVHFPEVNLRFEISLQCWKMQMIMLKWMGSGKTWQTIQKTAQFGSTTYCTCCRTYTKYILKNIWWESCKHSGMCVCIRACVGVQIYHSAWLWSSIQPTCPCHMQSNHRPTGIGQHFSEAEVNFHTLSIYKSTGCQHSTDRTSEVFSYYFFCICLQYKYNSKQCTSAQPLYYSRYYIGHMFQL